MPTQIETVEHKTANRENIARTLGLEHHRRPSWRRWVWRLTLVLIVLALAAWGYSRFAGNGATTQYVTQPVEHDDIIVTVVATGTLEPTNQVDVGSELSGIVRQVNVDYNDTVARDQVLAALDTSKFESQVAQSKAALQLAEAEVLRAAATLKEQQFDLDRLRRIAANGGLTEMELVTAEAEYDRAVADEAAARASVAQAQAALDAVETDLAKTVIRSPIDGIVLTRSIEPGQTVAASFQAPVLFTLAENLSQMELQVDVDEADISQVSPGQPATFTVDAYAARKFDARITQTRYGPEETNGVVTYKTLLLVDNADLALRPGMTATATITVKHVADVMLVPNSALRFSPPEPSESESSGGLTSMLLPHPPRHDSRKNGDNGASNGGAQHVWILKEGQPVQITVTTGETDGSRTAVTAPELTPGVEVIVDAVETNS